MLPSHHHTNDTAAHLPLTPYINQVNLHHLNSPNDMSRHVVWANGNFLFFISFYFIHFCYRGHHVTTHYCINNGATHLPLAPYITWINLHHSNGPNNVSRCIIWAYSILFYFYFICFFYQCCHTTVTVLNICFTLLFIFISFPLLFHTCFMCLASYIQ